ncbi:hypothetical protein FRAAL0563 [Frankia alni ACN14a]|uniref:Uncharacterized protein n=1 Tax=Frankia alni (strain DSM 45986 / CECT 9034 / ACN14a) TaxID=326424 RepID=Q0RT64_FRAAA|nr:hypothetical protein [Frankia sp. AvcI1]CAJ59238.1 hypothetical protein FRAAL0563 [Frankia alni ACN14a]
MLVATDVLPIPGELAVSVISIAELQFGVLVARTPEARANRLADRTQHDLLDLVLGHHGRVAALHRARQDAPNQG